MWGIKAPGALSFRPLPKLMRQALKRRYRFMGGLERVCTTSTASSFFGLGGLLISSSLGVMGVCAPLGVSEANGPL